MSTQGTMFGDTARTGRNHPVESRMAAAQVTATITEKQSAVFAILFHFGPMTDDELREITQNRFGWAASTARARRAELTDKGLVRKTEHRGMSATGNPCAVWEVVPA